jgi:hypothetical protein
MREGSCRHQFIKALTSQIHTTTILLRCRPTGSVVHEAPEDPPTCIAQERREEAGRIWGERTG